MRIARRGITTVEVIVIVVAIGLVAALEALAGGEAAAFEREGEAEGAEEAGGERRAVRFGLEDDQRSSDGRWQVADRSIGLHRTCAPGPTPTR